MLITDARGSNSQFETLYFKGLHEALSAVLPEKKSRNKKQRNLKVEALKIKMLLRPLKYISDFSKAKKKSVRMYSVLFASLCIKKLP